MRITANDIKRTLPGFAIRIESPYFSILLRWAPNASILLAVVLRGSFGSSR
jgi:hypothetical protein